MTVLMPDVTPVHHPYVIPYVFLLCICSSLCHRPGVIRVSLYFLVQVEAKIFELQEAMADRGYSDAEIEDKVSALLVNRVVSIAMLSAPRQVVRA